MKFLLANLLSFLAFIAMVVISLVVYGDLPESLPSQFSLSGEVQDTRPRDAMILLLPGIYLGLIFLINVLVNISPHKFSMPNSKRPMDIIVFGIGVMFCFLHIALLKNQGEFLFFVRWFSYGMALFLVIVGNVFGKTERNFFIGIRLPWTIATEANWRATHRLAGRLMVLAGAILIITNSVMPNMFITVGLLLAALLSPIFYSYWYFVNREKQSQTLE